MKNKLLYIVVSAVLALSLVGCAGDDSYLGENADQPVFVQFADGSILQGPAGATGADGQAGAGVIDNEPGAANNFLTAFDNVTGAFSKAQPVIGDVSGLQTALDGKQATLVSGTNIKTVNGSTLLGAGDLAVTAADHSHTTDNITGGSANQTILSVNGRGSWTTLLMEHISGLVEALAGKLAATQAAVIAALGYTPADNVTAQAHYANVSNPHLVTAPQIGALSTANVTSSPSSGQVLAMDANGRVDAAVSRIVEIVLIADNATLTTGNGTAYFIIPSSLNGFNLVDADASLIEAQSSSGTPTINIYNVTDSEDILSTDITIDINEWNSYTAATQPVINGSFDDAVTGARWRIDISVAGTGAKGIHIILEFRLP